MLSDPSDSKTTRIALIGACAFHAVIAVIFLFITFSGSINENIFIDVQFI